MGKRHPSKNNVAAFTLIELLVAIAIIGVLAGSLVLALNPGAQLAKARDAQRKSDLEQIKTALDMYYSDKNSYPPLIATLVGDKYIQQGITDDPSSGEDYGYELKNSDGSSCTSSCNAYRLYANLERCSDFQGTVGVDCLRIDPNEGNYSISSSNLTALALLPTPAFTPTPTPVFICGNSVSFTYKGNSAIYGTVSKNGKCWLDRNLGASRVAISYADSSAYGDLFQWGRLDDGHQTRTSATTTVLSGTNIPGHSNFIRTVNAPFSWKSFENDSLWQGVSSVNNPCPIGWRVPTSAEWDTERASWALQQNRTGAFASLLKLTAGGIRVYQTGSITNTISYGDYWSSDAYTPNSLAKMLYFSSTAAGISGASYATGLSVRCIKD